MTLKSGGRLGDVDFALQSPPTFKLTGTLVDAKDLPVAGATVEIGGDWPLWGGTKARAHTDINGRFQLGPLMPEDYKIYVTAPGIKPSLPTMQTPSVKATIVDADVSDVVIRFPLR